jgi:transposase
VAFEAAYGWGWLVELLVELEPHLVIPAAPRRSPPPGTTRSTLAPWPSCWGPICCPRPDRAQATRELRALLRHRASLVRLSTSLKNRVHAVLADRGIGEDRGLWTGPGRAWLASLGLPAMPPAIVQDCCGLLDAWPPIARLEREIGALAKPDPRVQALMVLPGVGRLTAMTLVAEIGEGGRFPTARKRCAWAGLTPVVGNSDGKIGHGPITKQGSTWLRWILQQAAQTANKSPLFAGAYGQLARRRGTRSPPWRSPGGCWPAASTSSRRSRPPPPSPEKARPGALATPHAPPNPAVDLTEQPGPDATVMPIPTSGPNGCARDQLR